MPTERGPERLTVAEVSALLYSSHHPREALERVVRIPALSPGWRRSFEQLIRDQDAHPEGTSGNAGLVPAAAAQPSAPGFRTLRVSRIDRECLDVISLSLEPMDGRPLTTPLAGQFVVLRLQPEREGCCFTSLDAAASRSPSASNGLRARRGSDHDMRRMQCRGIGVTQTTNAVHN